MRKSRLMLLPEVADRLRRTEQSVRWAVHTKQIVAPAKIGGRLVWDEDALEAWISEQFEKVSA